MALLLRFYCALAVSATIRRILNKISNRSGIAVQGNVCLKHTFHWSAIPPRSWRSWSFFKLFQIAAEAWTWYQILVPARFQYASTTPRLRCCYDPTTTMKIQLCLVYADGDAVATLPRPRRWSYVFVAILIPFYIKSPVKLVYVQLNVNFQRYENNCCSGNASAGKLELLTSYWMTRSRLDGGD